MRFLFLRNSSILTADVAMVVFKFLSAFSNYFIENMYYFYNTKERREKRRH